MFEPRCPDGKVKAKACGPLNDLECVDQKSGTQAHGEAPVTGEPVTTSPEAPTAPSLSSGISWWWILGLGILVPSICVYYHKSCNLPGEIGRSDGLVLALSAAFLTSCFISSDKKARSSASQISGSFWPGCDIVPWDHPSTSHLTCTYGGRDHISPPVLGLMVTSSPCQVWEGRPVLHICRAPSQGRGVVRASTRSQESREGQG